MWNRSILKDGDESVIVIISKGQNGASLQKAFGQSQVVLIKQKPEKHFPYVVLGLTAKIRGDGK